jgi:hypothetical protein
MSEALCGRCGLRAPVAASYDLNGKTYCSACVKQASAEAKASGQPDAAIALLNKSVCARCNAYLADGAAAVQLRHLCFCQACAAMIKDWTYPQWLKLSFAGLVLLLAAALAHGGKYFAAGKSLYVGERLVGRKSTRKRCLTCCRPCAPRRPRTRGRCSRPKPRC